MYKIILDCDLMRYPDSGLYHYCLNLGLQVKDILFNNDEGNISFYVPPSAKMAFGNPAGSIVERRWHHKWFKPFLWDCDIWHAPFQTGRIITQNHKRIRVLLTIHDLNCLHEGKNIREQRQSLAKTQRLIDQSHSIVCISSHTYGDLMQNLDTGKRPVHVIHNGIHRVGITPSSPVAYQPLLPFLFTMGYVNRKKNFHTLIALLQDPGYELVIAGKLDDPDYARKIKKLAADAGVQERVHILGPISEEDKSWYLQHCQAFLLPSLAEGFGAPVVEAMQFGKPLFLSNRTSLPEVGGDAAFYFNDFEPLHMIRVFREGMAEFQKNGLAQKIIKRGAEFKWEDKARQYLDVYRSMLK